MGSERLGENALGLGEIVVYDYHYPDESLSQVNECSV